MNNAIYHSVIVSKLSRHIKKLTLPPFLLCSMFILTWFVSVGMALASNCKIFRYQDTAVVVITLLQIVVGAVLAFCMEVAEFMVVTHTSSLTLSVAGIFKVWDIMSCVFNPAMVRFLHKLTGQDFLQYIQSLCHTFEFICQHCVLFKM